MAGNTDSEHWQHRPDYPDDGWLLRRVEPFVWRADAAINQRRCDVRNMQASSAHRPKRWVCYAIFQCLLSPPALACLTLTYNANWAPADAHVRPTHL